MAALCSGGPGGAEPDRGRPGGEHTGHKDAFFQNENKKMLWELMSSNHYFRGLGGHCYDDVVGAFDDVMKRVHARNRTYGMLELNKQFLVDIQAHIDVLRGTAEKKPSNRLKSDYSGDLEKRALAHKTEMMELLVPRPPESIDFTLQSCASGGRRLEAGDGARPFGERSARAAERAGVGGEEPPPRPTPPSAVGEAPPPSFPCGTAPKVPVAGACGGTTGGSANAAEPTPPTNGTTDLDVMLQRTILERERAFAVPRAPPALPSLDEGTATLVDIDVDTLEPRPRGKPPQSTAHNKNVRFADTREDAAVTPPPAVSESRRLPPEAWEAAAARERDDDAREAARDVGREKMRNEVSKASATLSALLNEQRATNHLLQKNNELLQQLISKVE